MFVQLERDPLILNECLLLIVIAVGEDLGER
jgi:hypothetical protein